MYCVIYTVDNNAIEIVDWCKRKVLIVRVHFPAITKGKAKIRNSYFWENFPFLRHEHFSHSAEVELRSLDCGRLIFVLCYYSFLY